MRVLGPFAPYEPLRAVRIRELQRLTTYYNVRRCASVVRYGRSVQLCVLGQVWGSGTQSSNLVGTREFLRTHAPNPTMVNFAACSHVIIQDRVIRKRQRLYGSGFQRNVSCSQQV